MIFKIAHIFRKMYVFSLDTNVLVLLPSIYCPIIIFQYKTEIILDSIR